MAEAEDVITDAARHATIFARDLWRRRRKGTSADSVPGLVDVSRRIELLLVAVFGHGFSIRTAQLPAPPTFLSKLFKRSGVPHQPQAIPSTDGVNLWLPARLPTDDPATALGWYRALALRLAMEAKRDTCAHLVSLPHPLARDIYTVLEAEFAAAAVLELLPGMAPIFASLREYSLRNRPYPVAFSGAARRAETLIRTILTGALPAHTIDAGESSALVMSLLDKHGLNDMPPKASRLYLDLWTGELRALAARGKDMPMPRPASQSDRSEPPKSSRLVRRPEVREADEDEDDEKPGAWMVQTAQPHEQAEDPFGMQRPTDRDESTAAEEFADALSELPEARLVATPEKAREILLSDDLPLHARRKAAANHAGDAERLHYPEWDYRSGVYRSPGAAVHVLPPILGPQEWVDATLEAHRSRLLLVQRRFEMLRAQRVRVRKQLDGEDIDLEAYVESRADYRAGMPMAQRLYASWRQARRDLAIVLLIDVSGSTDAWVNADKRIIDVEREALLLVSVALQSLGEPYAVLAFSGEGPQAVTMRTIKTFDEPHGNDIARRIASLEPEHYTRAGAALRHASAVLMRQPARHRLLLLLSDGKPNDVDEYEGRYGVEDMRQAVVEAGLQGINPFCLTVDRRAADYLPAVFGVRQYALLPKPELLPLALLEWMKQIVSS